MPKKKPPARSTLLPPCLPLDTPTECRYCDRKIPRGEWFSMTMPGDAVCGVCTVGFDKTGARPGKAPELLFSNDSDDLHGYPLEHTYKALLEEFHAFREKTLEAVRREEKQAELLESLYCQLEGLAESDIVPAGLKASIAILKKLITPR